jgi:hypothetical protein
MTALITSPLVIARPILGPFWDFILGQIWSPLPNVACFSGFHTNIFQEVAIDCWKKESIN